MSAALVDIADGADLVFSGINFEDAAANVAERYGLPLATLHYFPCDPTDGSCRCCPAAGPRCGGGLLVGIVARHQEGGRRTTAAAGLAHIAGFGAAADHRQWRDGDPGL